MSDITERRNKIEKDHREFSIKALKEYEENVYYPARKQLTEDCRKEGHVAGRYRNNGLGWTFVYCAHCNAVMKKFGPDDKCLIEGIDY